MRGPPGSAVTCPGTRGRGKVQVGPAVWGVTEALASGRGVSWVLAAWLTPRRRQGPRLQTTPRCSGPRRSGPRGPAPGSLLCSGLTAPGELSWWLCLHMLCACPTPRPVTSLFSLIAFFFKDFIYLFMRDTERETETQAEGEAGSMQGA